MQGQLFSQTLLETCLSNHYQTPVKLLACEYLPLGDDVEISEVKHPESGDYPVGIFKYQMRYQVHNESYDKTVIIKSKVSDKDYLQNIAGLFENKRGVKTPKPLSHYMGQLCFSDLNVREMAIYKFQKGNKQLCHVMPELLGYHDDPDSGASILLLTCFPDDFVSNNDIDPALWNKEAINAVIDAISVYHKVWYDNTQTVEELPCITFVTLSTMLDLMPMWQALYDALRTQSDVLLEESDFALYQKIIAELAQWYAEIEKAKKTLIHNDFAPKNLAIKSAGKQSQAYLLDFELPTVQLPQYDVMEVLAYVIPEHHTAEDLKNYLLRHREQMGVELSDQQWLHESRLALYNYILQRLSLAILIEPLEPRNIKKVLANCKRMLSHINTLLGDAK